MKVNSLTLLAVAITLLASSPTIFGRTVDTSPKSEVGLVGDVVPLTAAGGLFKRAGGRGGSGGSGGSGGGSGGSGSGSGSGGTGGRPPKGVQLPSTATTADAAEAELAEWGMTGEWQDQETYLQAAYQLSDLDGFAERFQWILNLLPKDGQSSWDFGEVVPDDAHVQQYTDGSEILVSSINLEYGIHHTEQVFTTETSSSTPANPQPRELPVSKRTLIVNRWVSKGGKLEDLRFLSDGYIENKEGQDAFKNLFTARGTAVEKGNWQVVLSTDPDWNVWDDGTNPFPLGYKKMPVDYLKMQSKVAWVVLVIDKDDKAFHAVHYMEPITPLAV